MAHELPTIHREKQRIVECLVLVKKNFACPRKFVSCKLSLSAIYFFPGW
jgi:hypothetical protein